MEDSQIVLDMESNFYILWNRIQQLYPDIDCTCKRYKFLGQEKLYDEAVFHYNNYELLSFDKNDMLDVLDFVSSSNITHKCLSCNNDIYTDLVCHFHHEDLYVCIKCIIMQNTDRDDILIATDKGFILNKDITVKKINNI